LLKPLIIQDAPGLEALFSDWNIVRLLPANMCWPYPAGEALRFIAQDALPAMADGEAWHWSLRPRSEPERFIGMISLMDETDDNRAFILRQEWQGKGLISEASAAVTRFWFETLEQPTLRVGKAQCNESSRRISIREGMQLVDCTEAQFVCGPLQQEIWEITRDQWLARHQTQRAL
jgi:RimJ/RimL family protein N-acetyltransferase